VDNASYNGLYVVPGLRYQYKALFAQDDWKISRKLTLNIGLRWDLFMPRHEHNTNISGFDPSVPNPGAGNRLAPSAFLEMVRGATIRVRASPTRTIKAFGPRIGFAYQLGPHTVLRGGYGLSYGQRQRQCRSARLAEVHLRIQCRASYASTDAGVTPAFNWDGGFPPTGRTRRLSTQRSRTEPTSPWSERATGVRPDFQNYQFSVQQELAGKTAVELAYVGVKGTHLGNALMSINQVDPKYLSLGTVLTQSVTSRGGGGSQNPDSLCRLYGSVAQALRPYPQFLNIVNNSSPTGNSTYNALQVKLTKRLSHGITMQGAYTWAKSLTDGSIAAGGGPRPGLLQSTTGEIAEPERCAAGLRAGVYL
jgi:hypothetical protein